MAPLSSGRRSVPRDVGCEPSSEGEGSRAREGTPLLQDFGTGTRELEVVANFDTLGGVEKAVRYSSVRRVVESHYVVHDFKVHVFAFRKSSVGAGCDVKPQCDLPTRWPELHKA